MKALIDLDILPYAYGAMSFEDGALMPDAMIRKKVDDKIARIVDESGATDWVGYLTESSSNFRIPLATILPYKGNRSGSTKPPRYQMLRDHLLDSYPDRVTLVKGMEADDQLAIDQYTVLMDDEYDWRAGKLKKNASTIICTIDKDLKMVPGWHYNWNTDEKVFVTEIEGLRWFYKQLLMGDSTDNIKGLHGVGPKSTLLKYIGTCDDEWMMAAHVYEEYFKRFGHYASSFMRENAALLWMKRSEDDVFNYDHLLTEKAEARAPATHDWPAYEDWSPFIQETEDEDNDSPF